MQNADNTIRFAKIRWTGLANLAAASGVIASSYEQNAYPHK